MILFPNAPSVELVHVVLVDETEEQRPVSHESMEGMTDWFGERATSGTRPAMLRHSPPGPSASPVSADVHLEEMEMLLFEHSMLRAPRRIC